MKKRLDQLLVDKGLAPSKTKAQEMIEGGQVLLKLRANNTTITAQKPSLQVDEANTEISLAEENILKYVSRSGFKLEGALKHLKLNVKNFYALDIGQSTGGFTDCLLQAGAKSVVGVDVAKNELAEKLRNDPRVTMLTEINARNLHQQNIKDLNKNHFDLIVVDVSFISITKILPGLLVFLRPHGHLLALVKPQFEVGSVNLNKKGVVKSLEALSKVQDEITSLAQQLGLLQIVYFAAELKGRDGNQEYFIYGTKGN